ncbi:hypothetical protein [Actinomadura sp. 21ATH]
MLLPLHDLCPAEIAELLESRPATVRPVLERPGRYRRRRQPG